IVPSRRRSVPRFRPGEVYGNFVHVDPEAGPVNRVHVALPDLRRTRGELAEGVREEALLLDAEVVLPEREPRDAPDRPEELTPDKAAGRDPTRPIARGPTGVTGDLSPPRVPYTSGRRGPRVARCCRRTAPPAPRRDRASIRRGCTAACPCRRRGAGPGRAGRRPGPPARSGGCAGYARCRPAGPTRTAPSSGPAAFPRPRGSASSGRAAGRIA